MKRKGFVAEGDVTLLLKRYDSSTILSLLYEISKQATENVKWEEIVKDSNTGIKNAREYQALWRHLAYRKDLDPEGEDFPLEEDDSDLECDVEAFPTVSPEASAEAACYVDALMGFSTDIAFTNAESTALGLTSIYPVFSSAQAATFDSYRKKRKPWTAQEDDELAAGVEKYGEGNWGTILKIVFKNDRTATQLAQRWALIKKRRNDAKPAAPPPVAVPARQGQGTGPGPAQQSEQSLKKPKVSSELCEQNGVPALPVHPVVPSPASLPKQAQTTQGKAAGMQRKASAPPPAAVKTSLPTPSAQAKPKPAAAATQKLTVTTNQQVTCVSSLQSSTPTPTSCKTSLARTNSVTGRAPVGPDPLVQAAAVAAGARIAPASAAVSFMKAKNVVHVRPPTNSPSAAKPNIKNNAGTRAPPVVHYIRTGAPPPILPSFTAKRPAKATAAAATKNNSNIASRVNVKAGGNTISRLAVNSNAKDANKRRKIIVARENVGTALNSHVSSWYEVLDDTSGGGDTTKSSPAAAAAAAVVEVDSDTDEGAAGLGGLVCTSSNESAFGGAVTSNGASPLSQSSGGQSE